MRCPVRTVASVVSMLAWLAAPQAAAQTPCQAPTPQTTPPTFRCVINPTPPKAEFDFTNPNGIGAGDVFKLYVNNAQVGASVPASVGTVQIIFPALLPAGSYTVKVSVAGSRLGTPFELASTPVTLEMSPPVPSNPPAGVKIVAQFILRVLERDDAGGERELLRQVLEMPTLFPFLAPAQ